MATDNIINGLNFKIFLFKVKNKIKMFSFMSSIQHYTGDTNNQAREEIMNQIKIYKTIFSDGMILCISSPKEKKDKRIH